MNREDNRIRTATITVTLQQDKVEPDEFIKASLEQELNCCHCVRSIDKIELT